MLSDNTFTLRRVTALNLDTLKIAIVHDWLVNYAGADRVVDQLHQMFPNAPIYTLVYDKKSMPARFATYDIRTTYLQRLPFATTLYKSMLAWMPGAFESLNLMEYDLVISSCSCCSKGVITRPDAVHICYCHTPTRYIWDFYYQYMNHAGLVQRLFIPHMIHKVRLWDRLAADRVDHFIANSHFVAQRINKYYRRHADVIYPCVNINPLALPEKRDDYYLSVGRFTYYKRVDLAIEACTRLGKRLIVVGCGDEERKLRAMAGPTIMFRGSLTDEEILDLFSHAKAFLFPGEEDFGITPVEAQSAGCPVLAYGRGGVVETIVEGQTGLFFLEQTPDALVECITRFEQSGVTSSPSQIREHSLQFATENFRGKILAYCRQHIQDR